MTEAQAWSPAAVIEAVEEDIDVGDDEREPVRNVDPVAYHGVLGELALKTQPETEADPLFVMLHLMSYFGVWVGRNPHFVVSAHRHYLNLFIGIIGPSGVGRKGTASDVATEIWRKIDPVFTDDKIMGGLNSGAGLLYHLRDGSQKSGKNGKSEPDDGVTDKRHVFLEPELASVLMGGHRENDPMLSQLRLFFDGTSRGIIHQGPDESDRRPRRHCGALHARRP